MRVLHSRSYCSQCKTFRTFVRLVPHHSLYLLASIMSFGLMLIPWGIVSAYNTFYLGWRCEICGKKLNH